MADHRIFPDIGQDILEIWKNRSLAGLAQAVRKLVLEEGGLVLEAWWWNVKHTISAPISCRKHLWR